MSIVAHDSAAPSPPAFHYLERRPPVFFPESAEMPEGQQHYELSFLLYCLAKDTVGEKFTVGGNQFLYFDAEDPRKVLAPDSYVRLVPPTAPIRSWKTWERGAPEVCVEIISPSDSTASG